jgi:hypothetical protein
MKYIVICFNAILIIIAVIALNSCSPVPYANVGQNVPLFKTKGEVRLGGHYSTTDDAAGVGLHAAAAIDSSFAIMSSFYSLKSVGYDNNWDGHGRYFEIGLGKFKTIRHSNFMYDVFAGVGFGSIKNNDNAGSSLNVNFMKPFLQSSIGLATPWFEVAFTPRFALVNNTNYENNLIDPNDYNQAENFFRKNKTKFVVEPGITLRAGYKGLKANLNLSLSSYDPGDEFEESSPNTTYLGIGLTALISKRYLK